MAAQQMMDMDPSYQMRKSSKAEREDIRKIFNHFDQNGDNRISRHEIIRAVRWMGSNPTEEEFDEMMAPADKDKDGYVNFSEFEKIMMRSICAAELEEKMLHDAFNMFDLNGDGFISKQELMAILTAAGDPMAEKEAEDLLKEADSNNDGKISYKEFVKTMCHK